jgi:hypothetical protein
VVAQAPYLAEAEAEEVREEVLTLAPVVLAAAVA